MIGFSQFSLSNGLRVLVHEDDSTPMVAVNILYNVGARDESPDKTGFAHLFEHLMFGGSANIPIFDDPLQWAGGESNAFTNNDVTNYYDILPAGNLETAFWLESDRMLNLNFSAKSLALQQKVVVEEFKENYLNQPYGDAWHQISRLAYKSHPYRWPTIGLNVEHVEKAKLKDVENFFKRHYLPNNAILSVAGNIQLETVKDLAEKWFGNIPSGNGMIRSLPVEPPQTKQEITKIKGNVPLDAIFMAFHMPGRMDIAYYICDILTDILSEGNSSRLYRHLLKEQKLFSEIDSYITGNIDPGLLIIEGKPAEGVSIKEAEAAIWKELNDLKTMLIPPAELEKIKNKVESNLIFSESSILNKAINLAFYELLGDADLINREAEIYSQITSEDIMNISRKIFNEVNCSKVIYTVDGGS